MPAASDEYDQYAGGAYVMLTNEMATAETIAAYLEMILTGRMGLGNNRQRVETTRQVAEKLIALRTEYETH